jgi:uncharacterized protein (DUF697 family)
MMGRYEKIFKGLTCDSIKCLGFASIISAVAAIPLLFMSINRISSLQKAQVCLIRETTFYKTVDTAGSVLPFVSVMFGVFSLVRCRQNKKRLTSAIPAFIGLIIAVTAFIAYFFALSALAYNYPY